MKMRIPGEPGLESAGASDPRVQGLCRSLQETVAAWLMKPVPAFRDETGARSLIVSGGVACNSELRAKAADMARRLGLVLAIPEPRLCTDNGAMIAAAGAMLTPVADPWAFNADPNLPL
jgi:N6-L-threonylcarbamoyladenine synthase